MIRWIVIVGPILWKTNEHLSSSFSKQKENHLANNRIEPIKEARELPKCYKGDESMKIHFFLEEIIIKRYCLRQLVNKAVESGSNWTNAPDNHRTNLSTTVQLGGKQSTLL